MIQSMDSKGLYVARVLYPITVLGPGRRIGIWLSGCHRGCDGCSNPELWETKEEQWLSVERFASLLRKLIREEDVTGITFTGGDPMEQAVMVRHLLDLLQPEIDHMGQDVLLYTGMVLEDLTQEQKTLIPLLGALIDGPYQRQLHSNGPLIGSYNQRLMVLKEELKERYDTYMREHGENEIENFMLGDSVISVGIHKKMR